MGAFVMKQVCDENYLDAAIKCCHSCQLANDYVKECQDLVTDDSPFAPPELTDVSSEEYASCEVMIGEYNELCEQYGGKNQRCCKSCHDVGKLL